MDIRNLLKDAISHEIVNPSEAVEILGISRANFSNMVTRGTFCPIKNTSAGSKMFLRSDIEAYRDRVKGERYRKPEISANHPLLTILPRYIEQGQNELPAEIITMYGQLSEEDKIMAARAISALLSGLADHRVGFFDLNSKTHGISWVADSLSEAED